MLFTNFSCSPEEFLNTHAFCSCNPFVTCLSCLGFRNYHRPRENWGSSWPNKFWICILLLEKYSAFWNLGKPSHKNFVFDIWPWSSVLVGNTYTFILVCCGNFNVWATFKDVSRKSSRMVHTLHLVGSFIYTRLHRVGGIWLVPSDLWGIQLGAHKCAGKYHEGYLFQLHSSVLFREWLFINLTQ